VHRLYSVTLVADGVDLARQEWNDDYLTWDPNSYDGVEEIVLSPTLIWLPDIGIQNRSVCDYVRTEV